MIKNKRQLRNPRFVPAVIFVYDCFRLVFIILLMIIYLKPNPDYRISELPLLMLISPNALFPLMSLFLLIRFSASGAYVPLYITGKVLSMLCLIIWIFFSLRQIFNTRDILWAVFLFIAELGTVMGMAAAIPAVSGSVISFDGDDIPINGGGASIEGGE